MYIYIHIYIYGFSTSDCHRLCICHVYIYIYNKCIYNTCITICIVVLMHAFKADTSSVRDILFVLGYIVSWCHIVISWAQSQFMTYCHVVGK